MSRANVGLHEITHIAACVEPGLRGAVMVGEVFGKGLSVALKIPFIPVNHLAAHITSLSINNDIDFPFLALLVSGGHTALYRVHAWNNIQLVCQTADDAVGECFDKVAKILGLEYPGGVKIEKLSNEYLKTNDAKDLITFVQKPTKKDGFSYSGLKTAVLNHVNKLKQNNQSIDVGKLCASFQHEAIMQLVDKTKQIMRTENIKTIGICGGVSANGYLRQQMAHMVAELGGVVISPEMQYCTDNAAMIGAAAVLGARL